MYQGKYAIICKLNMHKYAKNMQRPQGLSPVHLYAQNMHKICTKYARYVSIKVICKICKNIHSPLC